MSKSAVKVILGAMTFGREGEEQVRVSDPEIVSKILDTFQKHGHVEVDTARAYGKGSSEEMLSRVGWQQRGLSVATKLFPAGPGSTVFAGADIISHSRADIQKHLKASLDALGCDQVDLYYMHAPDRSIPYEETFAELNEQYRAGKFKRLGLSNYMSWEVAQICELCKQHGWIQPTVYQGLYNAAHRAVEGELFPCLRKYGLSFAAFNPLSGGLFTGSLERDSTPEKGSRFDKHTVQGEMYRKKYWNDTYFDALNQVKKAAEKEGLTLVEVALRWLSHHSLLDKSNDDAIIIGGSSLHHIASNLDDLEKGPLSEEILSALDTAWLNVKSVAAPYYK